jgi:hypothetical protein
MDLRIIALFAQCINSLKIFCWPSTVVGNRTSKLGNIEIPSPTAGGKEGSRNCHQEKDLLSLLTRGRICKRLKVDGNEK